MQLWPKILAGRQYWRVDDVQTARRNMRENIMIFRARCEDDLTQADLLDVELATAECEGGSFAISGSCSSSKWAPKWCSNLFQCLAKMVIVRHFWMLDQPIFEIARFPQCPWISQCMVLYRANS